MGRRDKKKKSLMCTNTPESLHHHKFMNSFLLFLSLFPSAHSFPLPLSVHFLLLFFPTSSSISKHLMCFEMNESSSIGSCRYFLSLSLPLPSLPSCESLPFCRYFFLSHSFFPPIPFLSIQQKYTRIVTLVTYPAWVLF